MSTITHPIHTPESDALVQRIADASGGNVLPASVAGTEAATFALMRRGVEKLLVAVSQSTKLLDAFSHVSAQPLTENRSLLKLCPLTHDNAAALRRHLPWLCPVTFGMAKSFGAGDRLGLATPGHIQAIRPSPFRAVLAQQSIREMSRTDRSAVEVIDDAMWGAFQVGFRAGFGADADHLKIPEDIDTCVEAGYTMYTVDPGDHVDTAADTDSDSQLSEKYAALPWNVLQTSPRDCQRGYVDKPVELVVGADTVTLAVTNVDLLRAAVKYGGAVAHVATLYAHLLDRLPVGTFDFEVSVDETDSPTTPVEHFYIASELKRLGVTWTSLAPRFPGRFEKGVDFIGDLNEFRSALAQHAAIARQLGPYKISLHSGSDKFSIYPIIAELVGDLVHVKTAGTSYLEALRTLAATDAGLFREILDFSRERYPQDRATYHVSADISAAADPARLADAELPQTLDDFHTRQICHVTYGSVLSVNGSDGKPRFRDRLLGRLRKHEERYTHLLENHFRKHVAPFC